MSNEIYLRKKKLIKIKLMRRPHLGNKKNCTEDKFKITLETCNQIFLLHFLTVVILVSMLRAPGAESDAEQPEVLKILQRRKLQNPNATQYYCTVPCRHRFRIPPASSTVPTENAPKGE